MSLEEVRPDSVRAFYDGFDRKLLADYAFGNPRTERAIRFALSWINPETRRVLDVGCGIGWSSWEIQRNFPRASVLAIDLSPNLINIAQDLFPHQAIEFVAGNVADYGQYRFGTFDAVIMLDVYEHIPSEKRSELHGLLDKILGTNGIVILTFPSVKHQEYLRQHNPAGLQPIDEDIVLSHIEALAHDLHGEVLCFEEVSLWTSGDYNHAVVSRNSQITRRKPAPQLESSEHRRERVSNRLNKRVLPGGVFASRVEGPSVCVATPSLDAYSETFIRDHIERLPAKIHVLHGGHWPAQADGEPLVRDYNWLQRLRFRFEQQSRGLPWNGEAKHFKAVLDYLQRHQVQAVLAEYGPTGVAMMDVCAKAGIPLIVHFHGYDAYKSDVLTHHRIQYSELFASAAAVVSVSQDMCRQLRALGAPEHKLHYNPYGVDMSLFSGAEPEAALPVFVAVGRFVDKKGPLLTLLAFRQTIDTTPDARLVMIGEGPLLEAARQLADVLKMSHAVEFRGAQSHEVVVDAMKEARAFVQHSLRPSDGDSEGTPVAVLEASASGLPVISTRHAGIPDVVIDGETGLLVDELDVDGMAQAMIRLAREPRLAARLGQAGRRRIEEHFSMEKSIGNLWKIIEAVIKESSVSHATR